MSGYLFVYGTLMRGEPYHHLIRDCSLLNYIYINMSVYDTGLGYPAVFNTFKDNQLVSGELYRLPDNGNEILETLDVLESTDSKLFKRKLIKTHGLNVSLYEGLSVPKKQLITHGSWLRHNSLAKYDHCGFALNFEASHKSNYRRDPKESHPTGIHLTGDIPVLITAPHATTHMRDNRLKRYEIYTAAICTILHATTGAHALYSNYYSEKDPNYYDDSPFKHETEQIVRQNGIKLILDIHGTGEDKPFAVYPGWGVNRRFLHGNTDILRNFYQLAEKYGLRVGSEQVFPAARQNTIAKYCALKLEKIAIQVEINKSFRKPRTDAADFNKMIKYLQEFIMSCIDSL